MALLDRAWNIGGDFQRLMHYARTGHDPDWFKQYVQYEAAAEVIKIYNGKNVPLLVQTEAYAQAILKIAGRVREAAAESKARMERQRMLAGPRAPYVWILVDQEVLECPVGGTGVMLEQLRHLLSIEDGSRVSFRVVLRSAGPHPGHDGPFQVLKVHGREVAYAGAQIGGRLIEGTDEVGSLAITFDQIGAIAL